MDTFDPEVPKDDLPLLSEEEFAYPEEVTEKCVRASRALAELKGALSMLPRQGVLLDAIPLQEARASSEIENIVTSQDEVYRVFSAGEGEADEGAREVIRYRGALKAAEGKPLTVPLIEKICSAIMGRDMHVRGEGQQVYLIGGGRKVFTPPSGSMVRKYLDDLIVFAESNRADPLVMIALIHARFETVHPFMDGNGRTGRLLSSLLFQRYGILDEPVLFLSRPLLEDRRGYYRELRRVQRGEGTERWVSFMLDAMNDAAERTLKQVRGAVALRREFEEKLKGERFCDAGFLDVLFGGVYCKAKFLVDAGIAERQTAMKYLRRLEALGLLRSVRSGREVLFANDALMKVFS